LSPPVSLLYRFSLSSSVIVFSVVPLRRLHLGISTFNLVASAFVLQPWVLRPSFSSLLALAWTLDRRREVLSQMQGLPYVALVFSSHFRT
jgi:hypothetical protein